MRKHSIRLFAVSSLVLLCVGCASTPTYVDTHNATGPVSLGLEFQDFNKAAGDAVSKMLASGAVSRPDGSRYVLAISRIKNDTTQMIDTDLVIKKVRIELLNSGKVVVTTAVGLDGPEDPMAGKVREDLRRSDEFDQSGVPGKGQLQAPDLSLSGKFIERRVGISKREQQIEYYFQLTLTDINSGLAYWEGETPIVKRGSNKSVNW